MSRRLDKKLGCFCFGGLDLLEPQFDRENRMGALRPNVGKTERGERERETTITTTTTKYSQHHWRRGFRK